MSKKQKISGPFVPHTGEMLHSPAWRVLSLSALRVLSRIEIEHLRHGGKDNGKLPVTHADFRKYGIHDHAVGSAVREVCALGFVEHTQRGLAGIGDRHCPSLFRLTYLHVNGSAPTDEWRNIVTIEDAEQIARKARAAKPKRQWSFNRNAKTFPMAENAEPDGGNRHRSPMVETAIRDEKSRWRKPPVLSRDSSQFSRAAPEGSDNCEAAPAAPPKRPWSTPTLTLTEIIEITDLAVVEPSRRADTQSLADPKCARS